MTYNPFFQPEGYFGSFDGEKHLVRLARRYSGVYTIPSDCRIGFIGGVRFSQDNFGFHFNFSKTTDLSLVIPGRVKV